MASEILSENSESADTKDASEEEDADPRSAISSVEDVGAVLASSLPSCR